MCVRSGGWWRMRRSEARTKRVVWRRERSLWESDWARVEGAAEGAMLGAQPVLRERLGTRRLKVWISESSSSSSSYSSFTGSFCCCCCCCACVLSVFLRFDVVESDDDTFHAAISSVKRISPRTPHTATVSPMRTTALALVCVSEPVLTDAGRNWDGARPFTRSGGLESGEEGERCARR